MIAALILAAGESKRMGRPKMLLPWGKTTVLGQVIDTFRSVGISDVMVVTGGAREAVETIASAAGARTTFNPDHVSQEMLSSLQVGLRAMHPDVEAVLVALGDQPQIQSSTVSAILQKSAETRAELIVPSYQMRRGHPWLVARGLWDAIFTMRWPETPRDFLNRHAEEIVYVEVDTSSIVEDLDTPDDYLKSRR